MRDLPPAIVAENRNVIRVRNYVRKRLPLAAVPGVPEIRLHGAVPSSGLHQLARRDRAGFGTPYWAYHWAGGIALARYLLDQPGMVAGKNVVDLGTGSGIVAIAAALAGAAKVTAIDIDRYAAIAAGINASENGVAVEIGIRDVLAGRLPDADILMAGDLFYDEALASRMVVFLSECRAVGMTVLIGDPGRGHLPQDRLRRLADYRVRERAQGAERMAAIFAMI